MLIEPYFNDIENELYVNIYKKNYTNAIPYKSFIENKNNIFDVAKQMKTVFLVQEGIGLIVDADLNKKGLKPRLISCRELDFHIKCVNLKG